MNGQMIFIFGSLLFIIIIWMADIIYGTARGTAAVSRKERVRDVCDCLRMCQGNPLGIFKNAGFDVMSSTECPINRFVIGLSRSPKYGYDIQVMYDYKKHVIEITYSVPDIQGQFGSVTSLTWTVREELMLARYYYERLNEQVIIWEEEFHRECTDGSDNETDRNTNDR